MGDDQLNDGFPDFDRNISLDNSVGYMREILGYVPIEADGSVRVKVPANVAFQISVLDANARRIPSFPQHRALIYDYTDLLMQNGQAEAAARLLAAQITRHPSDTTLYDLQARAYAMQGKALEQHQAQAYSYAWQGKLYAALEQLELAKQAGGSFYQLSTVESDMRELREMLDERGRK